jgi:hypothetical protein
MATDCVSRDHCDGTCNRLKTCTLVCMKSTVGQFKIEMGLVARSGANATMLQAIGFLFVLFFTKHRNPEIHKISISSSATSYHVRESRRSPISRILFLAMIREYPIRCRTWWFIQFIGTLLLCRPSQKQNGCNGNGSTHECRNWIK